MSEILRRVLLSNSLMLGRKKSTSYKQACGNVYTESFTFQFVTSPVIGFVIRTEKVMLDTFSVKNVFYWQ